MIVKLRGKCKYLSLLLIAALASVPGFGAETAPREQLRDPTRPLSYRATVSRSSSPELALQAILNRQGVREAIVNGERVHAGDTVAGVRIDRISESGIVYSYGGQQQSLRLRPAIRK